MIMNECISPNCSVTLTKTSLYAHFQRRFCDAPFVIHTLAAFHKLMQIPTWDQMQIRSLLNIKTCTNHIHLLRLIQQNTNGSCTYPTFSVKSARCIPVNYTQPKDNRTYQLDSFIDDQSPMTL